MANFCNNCGGPLVPGAKFCGACGTASNGPAVQAPASQPPAGPAPSAGVSPGAYYGPPAAFAGQAASAAAGSSAGAAATVGFWATMTGKLVAVALTLTVVVSAAGLGAALLLPSPRDTAVEFADCYNKADIEGIIALTDPQTRDLWDKTVGVADKAVGFLLEETLGFDPGIGVSDVIENTPLLATLAESLGMPDLTKMELVEPIDQHISFPYAVVTCEIDVTVPSEDGEETTKRAPMLFPMKWYENRWCIVLTDPDALQEIKDRFPDEIDAMSGKLEEMSLQ